MRFTPSETGFADSGYAGWIFIAQARLVPRSNAAQCIARNSAPAQRTEASQLKVPKCGANRSATAKKGMSWQQMIASNAVARDRSFHQRGDDARRSTTVGRTNTDPGVANLLIVHARVIDGSVEIEHLR
jgi:hypothetical protein